LRLHAYARLTAHWCRTPGERNCSSSKLPWMYRVTKSASFHGLTEASVTWLVLGLVGPLMPAGVVALIAILRKTSPMYGPLFALAGVAVVLCALLLRPFATDGRRKSLKFGLDAAWNLWAFIGVGLLFVSIGTIGGDMAKLESQLKMLSPGWLSFAFITVCSTAAARFSLAMADWIASRRPKQAGT
jgi:hypothetical protein